MIAIKIIHRNNPHSGMEYAVSISTHPDSEAIYIDALSDGDAQALAKKIADAINAHAICAQVFQPLKA
jgi:hypothetical protein